MKTIYLIFSLIFFSISYSQTDFKLVTEDTIFINDKRPYEITIKVNEQSQFYNEKYKIEILVDNDISEIPKVEYEILSHENELVKNNEGNHTLLIKFKNPENIIQSKKIFMKINIYESEKIIKTDSSIQIAVLNNKLANYSYLGYIGTNFDLVDGLKTNNLFFASNIFVAPKKKKIGFYLSLYGNRTLSISDSINDVRRRKEIGIDSLNNSYSIYEESNVKRKMQTDNLGAFLSALIRLNKIDSEIEIYYSPSMEFIWRRNNIELNYGSPVVMDTIFNENGLVKRDVGKYNLTYKQVIKKNAFDFNLGILGILINHENSRISVRINMNTGISFRNLPLGGDILTNQTYFREKTDLFFTGRAWITERKSGVTLQAEVYNTYKEANPYYGVTLSKAFDLENLGNFFSPISLRN